LQRVTSKMHSGYHFGEIADREDAGVRGVTFFVAMTEEAVEAINIININKIFYKLSTPNTYMPLAQHSA
jgi:hypothetical protein